MNSFFLSCSYNIATLIQHHILLACSSCVLWIKHTYNSYTLIHTMNIMQSQSNVILHHGNANKSLCVSNTLIISFKVPSFGQNYRRKKGLWLIRFPVMQKSDVVLELVNYIIIQWLYLISKVFSLLFRKRMQNKNRLKFHTYTKKQEHFLI